MNARANHAKATDHSGTAYSYVRLAGNIVKMDPFTADTLHDTFGTEHCSILIRMLGKLFKSVENFLAGKALCRFRAH